MAEERKKVRVQLLDESTNAVLEEVDVLTSADCVTFEDGETFQQKLDAGKLKGEKGDTGATGAKGATGATGQRGSRWTSGTAITGTSTTATVFSSTGITDALVNDFYLNTSTGYVYRCTVAGTTSVAKWVYIGSIKGATGTQGAKGDTGPQGVKGDIGATGPQGPKGQDGDSIKIGTSYSTATQAKVFFKVVG